MQNQSLLRKADIALADLSSNGGVLLPEQANTFIRRMIIEPTLVRDTRVVTMAAPQRYINRIGFGARILQPAVSGTALTANQRSKPTTDQIRLQTSEVIAQVNLPYDVLEDNIESAETADNGAVNTGPGGLRTTLIEMIAERAALDLEELGILANPASGDAYLALQNGWLNISQTLGNVVDRQGASITKNLFKRGKMAMPKQYLRDIGQMRHYLSVDQQTEYYDTLADRPTPLGDDVVNGARAVAPYGSPLQGVALMPDSSGLYCNPKNLIFGIQRQISLEYSKDITARVYIIVLTARVALQVEQADAVVAYTNIGATT